MAYNTRTEIMAEASYDGLPFRVRTETIGRQGRRIVLHEYLKSDRIFAEDIGEIPPTFNIDAFIHSDPGQNNFLQKAENFRNRLRRRLLKPTKLTLPTIGNVNVIALDFSESRSQTSVGEVTFTLSFVKATGSIVANTAPARESDVYAASDDAREVIAEKAPRSYTLLETINNRLSVLHDFTNTVNDYSNRIRNYITSGPLGQVRMTIRNFVTNLPNLVDNPQNLVNFAVTSFEGDVGVFQDISNRLSNVTALDGFPLAQTLARSGSGLFNDMRSIRNQIANTDDSTNPASFARPKWNPTTVERQDRNRNRDFNIDLSRVNWLLIGYEQAARKEYTTNVEVETTREELSLMYTEVVEKPSENLESFLSDLDVLEAIKDTRNLALEVLELKEQQAFNLTTINYPYSTDIITASYDIYAEEFSTFDQLEARAQLIKELNPETRADNVLGDITIFQLRE